MKRQLLIGVVFLLQLAAQVAVTPIGEGMDFYGHWAYIMFVAEEGRVPKPEELAFPPQFVEMLHVFPGPDNATNGQRYRAWAQSSPAQREQIKNVFLAPIRSPTYAIPNYESQHPPAYYGLMSLVYPGVRDLNLDWQVYLLTLLSVLLAALALPALYLTFRLYLDAHLAALALLCAAWFPNFLPFLGRVTNDALAFVLLAWCVYFCLRPQRRTSAVLVAGILLVAGCYTKTYMLTVLPVYLLSAAVGSLAPGELTINWRNLCIASVIVCVGVGSLLLFNYATTGHVVLLTQMRDTESLPFLEKIKSIFALNPVWFFGGLAKGFWWSGYWSFVSLDIVYYLPLAAPLYIVVARLRTLPRLGQFLAVRTLWPHYLVLVFFVLGMVWHAALFKLRAVMLGETVHSGNEGWYMNVLVGSLFAIIFVLLSERMTTATFRRVLMSLAVFFMLWNLLARLVLVTFWGGQVEVEGPLRSVNWGAFLAALSTPATWQNWSSLPGVIQPILFTCGLPLAIAVILSLYAIRRACVQPCSADHRDSSSRPAS